MISKYRHKELTWIDLESPKTEETEHVLEQYPIPLFIKDKIVSGKIEDQIDINYDYIYVSIVNKVIFVVNNQIVLTIHNEPIQAFNEFSKEMELDVVSGEKINSHKLLFAYLLKNLYTNSQKQLILSENQIKNIQKQINIGNKKIKMFIIFIVLLITLLIISIWF